MKNELLEKVKEKFAKRHGYSDYESFLILEENPSDIISILFAKEFAKAELEKMKEEIETCKFLVRKEHLIGFENGIKASADLINKRIEEI